MQETGGEICTEIGLAKNFVQMENAQKLFPKQTKLLGLETLQYVHSTTNQNATVHS